MLTAVQFYNARGNMIELPLAAVAGGAQYVIKNIDGLGPPKANILTSTMVGIAGGTYQSSQGEMRNIVMHLGFDPDFTSADPYGDLRRDLYPWFSPMYVVEMRFITDHMPPVRVIGHVESNDPIIFSADPQIQISIICPQPNFVALTEVVATSTFPDDIIVVNPGTAEVGFTYIVDGVYWQETESIMTLYRTEPSVYPDERNNNILGYKGPMGTGGSDELVTVRIVTVKRQKSTKWMLHSDYDPDYVPPFPGNDQFNFNALGYIYSWANVVPGENTLAPSLPSTELWATPTLTVSFYPEWSGL